MNPGAEKGYALDFTSVIRHVATELERSPGRSSEALAASYQHPVRGDLSRVRQHHGHSSDGDAIQFLIERAVAALKKQVESDGNGGYRLTRDFDDLRYERKKIHWLTDSDDEDERRALRAMYNDLTENRTFYVSVEGARGATKERKFRLHPLARAIPQVSEKEFLDLAADIKLNGVELPIVVYNGQVLDGRHRLAIAAALGMPLQVTEVDGDEARAKARVLSLNVNRRHLTSAQRASIVRQLFLPEAKEKAKERQQLAGGDKTGQSAQRSSARSAPEPVKATEDAVKESGSLATVRSVESLAPLDDAPNTQRRVNAGELKTVSDARTEALKELGRDPEEKAPVAQPRSAYDRLGCARGDVKAACKAIEHDHKGQVTDDQIISRINEIRAHLDRAEKLITARNNG
ncbi:MAG: hypothetical protein GEU78_14405 [Actinobacteria bacterium]|nr:hypothetical protein [Actinomycetota bacterium]